MAEEEPLRVERRTRVDTIEEIERPQDEDAAAEEEKFFTEQIEAGGQVVVYAFQQGRSGPATRLFRLPVPTSLEEITGEIQNRALELVAPGQPLNLQLKKLTGGKRRRLDSQMSVQIIQPVAAVAKPDESAGAVGVNAQLAHVLTRLSNRLDHLERRFEQPGGAGIADLIQMIPKLGQAFAAGSGGGGLNALDLVKLMQTAEQSAEQRVLKLFELFQSERSSSANATTLDRVIEAIPDVVATIKGDGGTPAAAPPVEARDPLHAALDDITARQMAAEAAPPPAPYAVPNAGDLGDVVGDDDLPELLDEEGA